MTTDTLSLSRLKWHAGLIKEGPTDIPSISDCTWLKNNQAGAIEMAVDDAFAMLIQVNFELNGAKPSELIEKSSVISRQLLFAVERIRSMLRSAAIESKNPAEVATFLRLENKIAWAWSGILDGDIDDLVEYVDNQKSVQY